MKKCGKCKETKSLDCFYTSSSQSGGYQSYCKTCSSKRRIQYYKDNREQENKRRLAHVAKIRAKFRQYKRSLQCSRCNENRWYVLDFHHVNDDKDNSVGNMVQEKYGWNTIMAEINKCEVLCSNCHRELHWLENQEV